MACKTVYVFVIMVFRGHYLTKDIVELYSSNDKSYCNEVCSWESNIKVNIT